MGDRTVGWQSVAAAMGAAVLTACTTTVPGTALPAAAPGPPSTTVQTPSAPPVDVVPAPPLTIGTQLEALRIAAVTSLVQGTFPDRTDFCTPYGPQVAATDLEATYFPRGTAAPTLERYGFVASWGQCQSDVTGLSTITLVMELSDPESASRAAAELAAAAASPGLESALLPGTGVAALVRSGADRESVQAWAPVGRMLAYGYHDDRPGAGLDALGRLMADQSTLLASFAPTPQAEVPALPEDPNGLAGYTLDPPGELLSLSGPYDLEAYLRLAIDPFLERDVLTANGFTGLYNKQSVDGDVGYGVYVYAFPTSTQTNAVYTTFAEIERVAFGGTPFQLPSIPEAPCFVADSTVGGVLSLFQRCYVGHGSYLAGVDVSGVSSPEDVAEMDQLLPAQRDLIDG